MKRKLALLALLSLALTNVFAQGMGQPGFYGRIEIGNYGEQPPLLFPNAIMGNPGVYTGSPIYMHVPPQQAYYWSSYCGLYGACDQMVYFVQPSWYERVYVPGFRAGVFAYAPPPVYVAPPVYLPRPRPYPYYGAYYYRGDRHDYHHDDHHDHRDEHRSGPPQWRGNDGHRPPQPRQESQGRQPQSGDRRDNGNDGRGNRPPDRR